MGVRANEAGVERGEVEHGIVRAEDEHCTVDHLRSLEAFLAWCLGIGSKGFSWVLDRGFMCVRDCICACAFALGYSEATCFDRAGTERRMAAHGGVYIRYDGDHSIQSQISAILIEASMCMTM